MLKALYISILLLLFSLSKEEIPQDQKDLCERLANNDDDCVVELDDSYFAASQKQKQLKVIMKLIYVLL